MVRQSLINKAICGVMSLMVGLSVFTGPVSGVLIGKGSNQIAGHTIINAKPDRVSDTDKGSSKNAASDLGGRVQITDKTSPRSVIGPSNMKVSAASAMDRIGWTEYIMLARIIHAEAGGEPLKGQVAVGAVILNRIHSGKFPRTVTANVMKNGEFESVSNGYIWSNPTESSYRAARLAINGWDPTNGAIYFYNPAKTSSPWIWGRPIVIQIGGHNFAV